MRASLLRAFEARRMSFALHVFQALLSLAWTLQVTTRLDEALARSAHPHSAFVPLVMHGRGAGLHELMPAALLLSLAQLALTPWLLLAWLRALQQPSTIRECLELATQRYLRAVGIASCCGAYAATGLILGVGLAYLTHGALAFTHDARTQDLAALCVLLPFVGVAAHALTLLDASFASLSRTATGVRDALRAGLRHAPIRVVLERSLVGVACTLLPAGSWLLCRWLAPSLDAGQTLVLVFGQLAALVVTAVRSIWLARISAER